MAGLLEDVDLETFPAPPSQLEQHIQQVEIVARSIDIRGERTNQRDQFSKSHSLVRLRCDHVPHMTREQNCGVYTVNELTLHDLGDPATLSLRPRRTPQLMGMGFAAEIASRALSYCNSDLGRAHDLLAKGGEIPDAPTSNLVPPCVEHDGGAATTKATPWVLFSGSRGGGRRHRVPSWSDASTARKLTSAVRRRPGVVPESARRASLTAKLVMLGHSECDAERALRMSKNDLDIARDLLRCDQPRGGTVQIDDAQRASVNGAIVDDYNANAEDCLQATI